MNLTFDLHNEKITEAERFKIQEGLLVKEDLSVRSSTNWFSRLITRHHYSQSNILNIIKKEYKKAVTDGVLSNDLIHNYQFVINKAEAQNVRHEDSSAFARFFKAKSYINIEKHFKTWSESLQKSITSEPVTKGQGDYIAFYPNGAKLTQENFNEVYEIFNEYMPTAIFNRGEDPLNRDMLIKEKIKEIDPELEIAFVPRTLYELIFLRKCISEDVNNGSICNFINPSFEKEATEVEIKELFPGKDTFRLRELNEKIKDKRAKQRKEKKCWHFRPQPYENDKELEGINKIAYRLNKAIVKSLNPTSKGFTYSELCQKVELEITFLKTHFINSDLKPLANCELGGPSVAFSIEKPCSPLGPLSIQTDNDAEVIRKCVALECSKVAENSLLLFRGARIEKDSIEIIREDEKKPYSQSFGSSAFAGAVFDNGATAFRYMLSPNTDAYAVSLPFNQVNSSPFTIQPHSTLRQLYGKGETFHPRTKAWSGAPLNDITGFSAGTPQIRNYVVSDLSRKQIKNGFKKYKAASVLIKSADVGLVAQ